MASIESRVCCSIKLEKTMAGHIYKQIDLVGTSQSSISEAVEAAITKASETVKGIDWFEVTTIRGRVEDGQVAEYQVSLKLAFRIMSPEELHAQ